MNFRFRILALGVFLAAAAVVSPAFGQDVCANFDANSALYAKYTENYKGTLDQMKIAVVSGKEYIQTYAACDAFSQQVVYLKKAVPKLEEKVNEISRYERFNTALKSAPALLTATNDADAKAAKAAEALTAAPADAALKAAKTEADVKAQKASQGWSASVSEIFSSGKDILKFEPDNLDVLITLATVGLDESADHKNNTYNNEAINYAKSALRLLKSNAPSNTYGVLQYKYNSKENSLGWMNYTIGYIMYFGQKNQSGALPYFYQATQENSETKDKYFIYKLIGDYYRDEAIKLGDEIAAKIKTNQETNPEADPETYETKMMYALQKGFAERAVDAYARTYNVGKSGKPVASADYLAGLKAILETFYKFRYVTGTDADPAADISSQVMSYVASVSSKPFPSPSSEVQPVDPPAKEDESSNASSNTSTTSNTSMAAPVTPASKPVAPTNGNKGKSEADKTNNKP